MNPVEKKYELQDGPPAFLSLREGQLPAKRIKDLSAELLALHGMLAALAGSKIRLDMSLGACPQGCVGIAPTDLTRILINLVRNCAEAFSAMGQITISATGRHRDALGCQFVVIAVEDDGLAIPLSLLEKIFDTDASQDVQAGTDLAPRLRVKSRRLGLRVVKDLVELYGGNVRAIRLPERGSRFEIVLPMWRGVNDIAVA